MNEKLWLYQKLWDLKISSDEILIRWNEQHRIYHGLNHLYDIIIQLDKDGLWDDWIYCLSTIFHDIVYDPKRDDNEEKSVELFKKLKLDLDKELIDKVSQIIMDTKTGIPSCEESEIFMKYDKYNLYHGDFKTILDKTMLLFKEEQFMDFVDWKNKTIKFLREFENVNPNIKCVIEYLNIWKPNIGIYCGSFNKFHKGHYNILEKAEKIFDKVIIGRGVDPSKKNNVVHDLPEILKYHQVIKYDGLLTEMMNNLSCEPTLIRGLRNSNDFQHELTQSQYLKDLKPDIKIVYIVCDKEFEHISSSAIRSLEEFNEGGRYLI